MEMLPSACRLFHESTVLFSLPTAHPREGASTWRECCASVCQRKLWPRWGPGPDSLLSCLLRSQETYRTAMVVVLTFLPAPVVLVMVYGFWKKRHMGSKYSQPWKPGPRSVSLL